MRTIETVWDVYELTEKAIERCREQGHGDLAERLHDARCLPTSSGLELLGGIGMVFREEQATLGQVLGSDTVLNVIRFVNGTYGME